MFRKIRKGNNWKLRWTQKTIYKQLQFDLEKTSINVRSQSLHAEAQRITAVIHIKMEHHQEFYSRRFQRKSNWRLHNWIMTSRSSRRDGTDQAKNNSKINGRSK
jgi:hypothetical protein